MKSLFNWTVALWSVVCAALACLGAAVLVLLAAWRPLLGMALCAGVLVMALVVVANPAHDEQPR